MSALAIVKKVEGLIALAGSDRPEEARTSAFLACKIIREKGLHLVAELPREWAPPPSPAWQAPRKPNYYTSDAPKPRTIVTKFDCVCLDCAANIYIGDRCVWLKGKGCWHPECAP